MRFIAFSVTATIAAAVSFAAAAGTGLTVPDLRVGRNLQTWTAVRLPAPDHPLQLTMTSDDPSRLLLSKGPEVAGSPSITLTVAAGHVQSPEFCVQALADSGTATYTISAEGAASIKGAVTLAPSAILILGPAHASRYPTTPRAAPFRITVVAAALDSSHKVAEEQQLAGGSPVEITIASSNPGAGAPRSPKVAMGAGSSSAITYFQPAGEGETTLSPIQPSGFTTPAEMASLVAVVAKPGIAIAGDFYLGKDLQTPATVSLGEPAPPGGLPVTLTSADPSKLLLALGPDRPGSASVTVTVPAGQQNAPYCLQALGDSGQVNYTATAPGFRSRTAPVGFARSGIILAYLTLPEEGKVLHKGSIAAAREFFVSVSDAKVHPVRLIAWTAYIDRESGRAADFTVQPLRPGVSVAVALTNSNPQIGTVESPLVIPPGSNRASSVFTPLTLGTTTITVQTPSGFSTPKNAVSVVATVRE